jgi:cytochrome c-type biogenesis protein CcmH
LIHPLRIFAALLTSVVLLVSGTIAMVAPALAVQPGEMLSDPVLEARARKISAGLRCLVCQNQSIDDSDAPLARDLRVLVRERLTAGDDDRAIRAYLVQRYGDFVLLRPPLNLGTALLWLAPLFLLMAAAGLVARYFRVSRSGMARSVAEPPLTADEQKRLTELLEKK